MFVSDLRETVKKLEERTVDEEMESTMDLLNEGDGVRVDAKEDCVESLGLDGLDGVDGNTGCERCRSLKVIFDNGMAIERVVKVFGKGSPKCLRENVGMEKEWLWRLAGRRDRSVN